MNLLEKLIDAFYFDNYHYEKERRNPNIKKILRKYKWLK